jgi:hypothetical protein
MCGQATCVALDFRHRAHLARGIGTSGQRLCVPSPVFGLFAFPHAGHVLAISIGVSGLVRPGFVLHAQGWWAAQFRGSSAGPIRAVSRGCCAGSSSAPPSSLQCHRAHVSLRSCCSSRLWELRCRSSGLGLHWYSASRSLQPRKGFSKLSWGWVRGLHWAHHEARGFGELVLVLLHTGLGPRCFGAWA